jgi:hypothetical protein
MHSGAMKVANEQTLELHTGRTGRNGKQNQLTCKGSWYSQKCIMNDALASCKANCSLHTSTALLNGVATPASYSGSSGFELQPGDRISRMRFFVVSLSPSKYRDSTLKWTTATTFHIISNSLHKQPVIRRCKVKVNVKLSQCFAKHHAMKTYWGSGGIAPRIL